MKKLLIFALSLISIALTSVGFLLSEGFSRAKAEEATSPTLVSVETFLPSSSLQLYDLVSPVSISYSERGYLVISEHIGNTDGSSLFDRISVYNPDTERYLAIPNHSTIYNVTHATEWNGYIFYLSGSKLYYVPVSDLSETPTETSVTSSNFFMIKGEFLITNTNNTIVIYKVSLSGGAPTFEKTSTHNFTTKNAFISENNNVYYLFGGKLYCFDTASSTSYIVSSVSVDVNYMAEFGDYIFLSSASGIYRILKGKNQTLEQVTAVAENETSLGYLSNPQGITVMGETLLIADPTSKCVQAITLDGKFTDFAITTESTAEFRLTNNASHLSLSENYAYALDDGAQNTEGVSYKRLVKTALDKTKEDRYQSISLAPLYEGEEAIEVKYLACSDTHVAIYHGKTLSLYEIASDSLKTVYETESESVTSLYYLDGEFYYTDYALLYFGYNAVNINKIVLPSEDNGNREITVKKINENVEIKGVAINSCVDVFGNFYLNLADTVESEPTKLIKYSNGTITELFLNDKKFKTLKTDFAGNVYGLTNEQTLYKFSYALGENGVSTYKFNTELPVKDIDLSYRSNVCYILSNASILNTRGNELRIANLSDVYKTTGLETILDNVDGKFITVDKNAKLFKVTLGDYTENGNFKTITPVTNPRSDKVYLIVDEIDNYYLVSYSDKFVALVRKTDANYSPDIKFTSAIISSEYYSDFNISVNNLNKTAIISNDSKIFSKPLFSNSYAIGEVEKGKEVYALQEVVFNGVSMTLISDNEDKTPSGYIVSGYLNGEALSTIENTQTTTQVISSDGRKHFNNMLMVMIIALTVTCVALFIEKKLLFDKDDGNKAN